jgi:hypothetical protein
MKCQHFTQPINAGWDEDDDLLQCHGLRGPSHNVP